MYILITEVNRIGFIIDSYTNIEDAKVEFYKIRKLGYGRTYHEIKYILERLSGYKRYEILNERIFYNKSVVYEIYDGEFNTFILKLGSSWPTIDSFIKEREFQTELFLD